MLSTERTLVAVERMIAATVGEVDGLTVMDYGVGTDYATDVVWLSGDFNTEQGERLARALERIGVKCLWYDEWTTCTECGRAVRTEPDSYAWQPCHFRGEYGAVCSECIILKDYTVADLDTGLESHVNNSSMAFNFTTAEHWLERQGWAVAEDWDETPRVWRNGWYGREDRPEHALEIVQSEHPGHDVVFVISSVGQFETRFKAYTRPADSEV